MSIGNGNFFEKQIRNKKEGRVYSLVFTVYNKLKREPDANSIPSLTCLLILTIYRFAGKSSLRGKESRTCEIFGKKSGIDLKNRKNAVS